MSNDTHGEQVGFKALVVNEQMERSVLSAALYEAETIPTMMRYVSEESFFYQKHRLMWAEMMHLIETDRAVSLPILVGSLSERNLLEKVGGEEYIREVARDIIMPEEAETVADMLHEAQRRRGFQRLGRMLDSGMGEGTIELDEAQRLVAEHIQSDVGSTAGHEPVTAKEAAREFYEDWENQADDESSLMESGILSIDNALGGGVATGRFYLIAGKPKMGKTKLTIAYLVGLHRKNNIAIDFWYTDGGSRDVTVEFLANIGALRTDWLQDKSKIPDGQRKRFERELLEANMEMQGINMNIHAVDAPSTTQIKMRTRARLEELDDEILIVVVDYLQAVDDGHTGDMADHKNATAASKMMASLRSEHSERLISWGLSQFNRETKGAAMPKPGEIRWSGRIEQDVNHLGIFHRPAMMKENASPEELRRAAFWHARSKHAPNKRAEINADCARNQFTTWDDMDYSNIPEYEEDRRYVD